MLYSLEGRTWERVKVAMRGCPWCWWGLSSRTTPWGRWSGNWTDAWGWIGNGLFGLAILSAFVLKKWPLWGASAPSSCLSSAPWRYHRISIQDRKKDTAATLAQRRRPSMVIHCFWYASQKLFCFSTHNHYSLSKYGYRNKQLSAILLERNLEEILKKMRSWPWLWPCEFDVCEKNQIHSLTRTIINWKRTEIITSTSSS